MPAARTSSGPTEETLGAIDAHLRQRELRRDSLFERSRRLRRLAQGTMRRLHEGEANPPELAALKQGIVDLTDWLRREGRGDESLAGDAVQEAVEAILLGAVIEGGALPGPATLGVDPEPYLLGLGDLVGEVRRLALTRLARNDLTMAEEYLALMERLYHALMRFDTTRAIVQLKPKQDAARGLLERTRGEVVMARYLARAHGPEEDR